MMLSFAPEESFLGVGLGQIGIHRKIHTQKLEFVQITQLELHYLERNNVSNPCIRRLSPQYDRQSKFWCPNETIR